MDDEIIIGINRKDPPKKSKKTKKKKKTVKASAKKEAKIGKGSTGNKPSKKGNKKNAVIVKIVLAIIVFVAVIIGLSNVPLFNIKHIEVVGNNKLSEDKIIALSGINDSINLFKLDEGTIKNAIKENAYVENVEVNRKFPNKVVIDIKEREAKYMLQFADSYVYINNQGYMLEISNEKIEVPIIVGFTTDLSNIKPGNRIKVDDLQKMNMVIKIFETAKTSGIGHLITKIDISNSKNYTIGLESEGRWQILLCSRYP